MGKAVATAQALEVDVGPQQLSKRDGCDVTILQEFDELETPTFGNPRSHLVPGY